MYEYAAGAVEATVAFVTSQAAGIFALLFFNNVLMYLVLDRWHNREKEALTEALITKDLEIETSDEHVRTLKGIVQAFSDEMGWVAKQADDATPDCFGAKHCYTSGCSFAASCYAHYMAAKILEEDTSKG